MQFCTSSIKMKLNLVVVVVVVYANCFVSINAFIVRQLLDNYIDSELYFGFQDFFNTTHKDCVWRNAIKDHQLCTNDVKIWLYTNGTEEVIDTTNRNWLRTSNIWDANKENVIFVHGYAGGDLSPPQMMVRDAFAKNDNEFNFFLIDYGPVSRAPCYVSLVQNIKYVSHCMSSYFKHFIKCGMPKNSITCLGHSIGSHVCGLMKRYLGFRINKIIGLDPALPLVSIDQRLSQNDAHMVHTIQTNAGHFGDIGSIGHVDICMNNGNVQPFCTDAQNPNLCSHLYALCFLTESIFAYDRLYAKRCSEVCPHMDVFQIAKLFDAIDGNLVDANDDSIPNKIEIGMNIPKSARGSYCLSTRKPPFCKTQSHQIGSRRCCSLAEMFS